MSQKGKSPAYQLDDLNTILENYIAGRTNYVNIYTDTQIHTHRHTHTDTDIDKHTQTCMYI